MVYKENIIVQKLRRRFFHLNKTKNSINRKPRYLGVSMTQSGHVNKKKNITEFKLHIHFKREHAWTKQDARE